jgi:hypothetical protein
MRSILIAVIVVMAYFLIQVEIDGAHPCSAFSSNQQDCNSDNHR